MMKKRQEGLDYRQSGDKSRIKSGMTEWTADYSHSMVAGGLLEMS